MGGRVDDERMVGLYRKYGPVILSRCRRLLGDHAAAEDATQETFVRVYKHLAKAPDDREALLWIYRIATNYCLNQLRDRKRRPELHVPFNVSSGDSERTLANENLARYIISQLPERQRAVAWLYHVDGMGQEEVARVLGLSRRTIVTCLSELEGRAQQLLRSSR